MPNSTTTPRHPGMSVEEFLAWAGSAPPGRHQLVDGEVRSMSPASTTHGTIQGTLAFHIARCLNAPGNPCRVVTEPAIATRIRASSNQRVPDLGVTCTPDAKGEIDLPDPILLVEIISPGNTSATWENVWAYTSLPSVQEILVLQSVRIEAEVLRRQSDGTWPKEPEFLDQDASLRLTSINLKMPLRDVYAKTYLAS